MKKLLVSLDYMKAEKVGGICHYIQEILRLCPWKVYRQIIRETPQ